MTIFDETGFRYPAHWRETFEVCADRGYGAKVAEFEQLNTVVVKAEMTEVINSKRVSEQHHSDLAMVINNLFDFPATVSTEEWIDALMEEVAQINSACKYED